MNLKQIAAGCALALSALGAQAVAVSQSTNAAALVDVITGTGIQVVPGSQVLGGDAQVGTFSQGGTAVGFSTGVVLTTGTLNCVGSANQVEAPNGCSGAGTSSSLSFRFTADTDKLTFKYVFGSEEYNEFIGLGFNDQFELRLNGENIAFVPETSSAVSIDNVNCLTNSDFFRNNSATGGTAECTDQNLAIEYDGLTVVLTATANLLAGENTFQFIINDVGDEFYDSAVFIQEGSFSAVTTPGGVPEPGTLALAGLSLVGLAAARRRRRTA